MAAVYVKKPPTTFFMNISNGYSQQDKQDTIYMYSIPIIVGLGILGNFMSFVVLQTRHFRNTPSRFLLSALAVVDTLTLITGLLPDFFLELEGEVLLTNASCKTLMFLQYHCAQLSAWTLVLITLERLICVTLPHRARHLCSPKRCIIAFIVIVTILFIFNTPVLCSSQFANKPPNSSTYACYPVDAEYYYNYVLPWLDFVLCSLIPFVFIAIANAVIIREVMRSRHFRADATNQDDHFRGLTIMLLVVSMTFLITTTPSCILVIANPYYKFMLDFHRNSLFRAYRICFMLYYMNNAMNFLLYCVSGSKFRAALRELCCRCCHHRRESQSSQEQDTSRIRSQSTQVTSHDSEPSSPHEVTSTC